MASYNKNFGLTKECRVSTSDGQLEGATVVTAATLISPDEEDKMESVWDEEVVVSMACVRLVTPLRLLP